MRIKFRNIYWLSIIISLIIVGLDLYFYFVFGGILKRFFWPIIIIALTLGWLHFWVDYYKEMQRQKAIELKFLEFVRSLVETVKSGITIPMGILHVSKEDYGELTPYIRKLANQVGWGIPLHKALIIFADDTANKVIKRSISIIIEADESGGDIADVMDSVAESVINVKRMREERRASTYSQIVQGYVVYFIFIGIMLVLQLWLFPKLGALKGIDMGALGIGASSAGGEASSFNLDSVFFGLIMIQGFFAGLMIGKFSEGNIKQGLIHSLVLMTLAAMVITTAKGGLL
jgi:flagellar protein FlaJ